MAYFEHESAQTALDSYPEPADMSDHDRDNVLAKHGILVPCDGEADLCLTDAVRRAWTDALDAIGADVDAALLESALVDAGSSEFAVDESAGDFVASVDGAYVGRWPSCEAFLADATDAVVLTGELPGWHGLSSRIQSIALGEPRLLLGHCPTCGGDPDSQC